MSQRTVLSSRRQARAEGPPLTPPVAAPAAGGWLVYGLYPIVLLVALIWCSVHPLMDPDCWLHMAFGRYLLANAAFPPGDVFSFTSAGHEWISSGWLASVLMELIFRQLAAPGLVGMVFVIIVAVYLGVYFVAVRQWGSRGALVLVLLAAALGSYSRFTPRPEVFSQLMLPAVMLLLVTGFDALEARPERLPRRLWLLPVLFALWANLHAGFLIGFVPVGLCALACVAKWRTSGRRAWMWAALACLLALGAWIINPYGIQIALLSQRIKALPGLKQIVYEWKPMFGAAGPNLPWPILAGLGVLLALWLTTLARGGGWRLIPWWQTLSVAVFIGLALYELRHAALLALMLALVTGRHLGWLDASLQRARFVLPTVAVAAVLAICAMQYRGSLSFGRGWPSAQLDDSLLPYTATKYLLANRPPANLYNSYGPGGYLLYHLGPQTKVFIDGRNDVYTEPVWRDCFAIQDDLVPLDEATRRYGLNSFLIYFPHNSDNPHSLATRLSTHPAWRLVYFDDAYALFVRHTPQTADYLRSREFRYVSPYVMERFNRGLDDRATRPEVMKEIERAMELSGQCAKAHLLASTAYQAMGNRAAYERHYQQAMERNPGVTLGQVPEQRP